MEKDVEKIYDDVLESLNCENDEFISSYFEDDDITDEMQGNTMENENFEEKLIEEIEELPVENYVDNVDEIEEFEVKLEEIPVENYESEVNNSDIESLLASSEEFDNVMIELDESAKNQDDFIENEIEVLPEELVIEEELAGELLEKEEFTTDDLLELIEETDNSEEFFEKLEDKLDD